MIFDQLFAENTSAVQLYSLYFVSFARFAVNKGQTGVMMRWATTKQSWLDISKDPR